MSELRQARHAGGGVDHDGGQSTHLGKAHSTGGEHPSLLGRHTGSLASQRKLSTRRLAPVETAVSPVSPWHHDDLSASGSRKDLGSPTAIQRLPVPESPLIGKYAQRV